MKNPWGRIIAVPIAGLALYACSASSEPSGDIVGVGVAVHPSGGGCGPGRAGCACSTDGASIACGDQVAQSGNYVTCSMGTSVCRGGSWGPCLGNTLVTRSLTGTTLGPGGLHTLSLTLPCDDKCDPNQCVVTTSNGNDVDASLAITNDAAVTLIPPKLSGCVGTQCQIAYDCPPGSPTTLTGVVHDPAGVNPVYNAMVYIPLLTDDLPPFSSGATCDACAGTQAVQAVAVTQTAADGSFTLTYVPATNQGMMGQIPLVVQLGKWRRKVLLNSVPKCTTTTVLADDARLPRNGHDGFNNLADLPHMAIATGQNDPMECLLLKMGVDPAEFEIPTTPAGPGHVDFFLGNGLDLAPGAPQASQLYGQASSLMPYDLVLLPCQGQSDLGTPYSANLESYLNAGGRAFLTHYSYTWLTNPGNNPYFSVANWNLNDAEYAQALDTTIDTGTPKGQAFSTWLTDVGASTTPGHLTIGSARHDVDSVNAPATEWIHDTTAPHEPFYFSFDTPLGATAPPPDAGPDAGGGACGRVTFSDFHVSTADLVTSGNCTSNADCGFTATCNTGAGGTGTCEPWPCGYTFDCPDSYTCVGSISGTCVELGACKNNEDCQSQICQPNGTCAVTPGFKCFEPWECGDVEQCTHTYGACQKTCTTNGDCTDGQLCTGGECTGCLDASYCHTSGVCNGGSQTGKCSATGDGFPLKCQQGPLTPQEDALEFMLLDLTSCDTAPPPPVVQTYEPLTFTEDFVSSCPKSSKVIWRELDWQAVIPGTASIVFSAQSTATPLDGGAPDWNPMDTPIVPVATATASTTLPGSDFQFLDTGTTGVFNTAMPPVGSSANLRLTITMSPTSDRGAAPTLLDWSVKADCVASE